MATKLEEKMQVNLKKTDGRTGFVEIYLGGNFLYGGHAYLKLEDFIHLSERQLPVDGSTKRLGGYNAVKLSTGALSSFQPETRVEACDLIAVPHKP